MQILPLPDTIDSLTFEASPERTPGLHLSQILKSICAELDPKRFSGGPLDFNKIETGFTFERVLETAFQSRRENIFRPGEIELDGVLMSPDGLDASDPAGLVLEEFKCTWMSDREAPHSTKFWHWLAQMKAYCYALGTTRARLRALFVNGNYKNSGPTYHVWDVRFTETELDENWRMVVGHARMKGWLQ